MIKNNEISKLNEEIEQLKLALATTNSTVAQLASALELKADKNDIVKQINANPEVY